jgi:Contractile injection system tube protein
MGLNIFKLEKLKFESFTKITRKANERASETFEAMFNPTELEWHYEIKLTKSRAVNSPAPVQKYSYSEPTELSITLILDGTGVENAGGWTATEMLRGRRKTVLDRVRDFKKTAYDYHGDQHQPRHLRLSWGAMDQFDCRLCKLDVKYTMFDRDGSPLRAELRIMLHADAAPTQSAIIANRMSPDMTHSRIVRAGDTLPLMTTSIYGSPDRYLDVARFNRLDDFRHLTTGQELLFPPLTTFDDKSKVRG